MGPVTALGQDSLERAVRAAGIDATPVWLDETVSTNDQALALAAKGAPEWTVVATGHQTRGRGRLGRSWSDIPGKALLFSVIIRSTLRPEDAPVVGLMATVAMIASTAHPGFRAKWPNDLVFGERKAGGILTEASTSDGALDHVVVGVGLNVDMTAADFPEDLRATVTSLLMEGMAGSDQEMLLEGFLAGFRRCTRRPVPELIEEYRSVCATLGRRVRVTTVEGDQVTGVAVDIDEHGALVVRSGEGADVVVAFGQIEHLR